MKASSSDHGGKTVYLLYSRAYKASRDRLSGALRYFYSRNDVSVVRVESDPGKRLPRILSGASPRTCGLLCLYNLPPNLPTEFPTVALVNDVRTPPRRTTHVICDDAAIAQTAARFLLARGHVSFAYVGNTRGSEELHSRIRERAFRSTLAQAGHTCSSCRFSFDDRSSFHAFLKDLTKPCAIMAYNDDIAQEVLDSCHEIHLQVPDQINIIGVDNDVEICECVHPSLTSIQPDFEQAGYRAAELLMQMFAAPRTRFRNRTYGVLRIVERETTQDINGSRRLVTKATAWLKAHFTRRVRMVDLAHDLGTCRRRLEMRFREITKHTLHDELERLRIESARDLLVRTSHPISEIALSVGYQSMDTFRAAFKSRTGLTPTVWRHRERAGHKGVE